MSGDYDEGMRVRREVLGEVVDAAEVLHDDALDAQVVAPDLLDELGVVPALDEDPARPGDAGARLILLDNFTAPRMREAVAVNSAHPKPALLEVSGSVELEQLRVIAASAQMPAEPTACRNQRTSAPG